jgi:hypothetical protein
MGTEKFSLGKVVMTPGVQQAFEDHGDPSLMTTLLKQHHSGFWGDVGKEDAKANDQALINEERIFSVYKITPTLTIWIITEPTDRRLARCSPTNTERSRIWRTRLDYSMQWHGIWLLTEKGRTYFS